MLRASMINDVYCCKGKNLIGSHRQTAHPCFFHFLHVTIKWYVSFRHLLYLLFKCKKIFQLQWARDIDFSNQILSFAVARAALR